ERADLAAYRRARRRARTRRLGTGALGLTVLALLWQLIAMLINDPVFLPSVSQTVASFAHYFGRPYPSQGKPLWFDALTSLRRILIGFAGGTRSEERRVGKECRPRWGPRQVREENNK